MTGEMHQSEVTRENFPAHFAIADALGGTVHAFDQYQGPFVHVPKVGRLWLCSDDGTEGYVYNEANDRKSDPFWLAWEDPCALDAIAAEAARQVIT